ncbi:Oidioi.mRNA.OKI2018_I69.PAR.g11902.t1.cds [Oikopleura dioica]|uniref:Oidioi.mRNA.OKI2018_I69.PAR.g11902.t1.cds n=1 Tax=Oikopleura dioica TaxID=34765 RepID=A0ABN7RXW2_OIKDI|nr:Oidioi.mRNA.OKI2018_I69.PAR.g11902.t1.cds [Oikopleura dioica]
MEKKTLNEDFERGIREAKNNWSQVGRSLDMLIKSESSKTPKIQAMIRRLQFLTRKQANMSDIEYHWDSMMRLDDSKKSPHVVKQLTIALSDCAIVDNVTPTHNAITPDESAASDAIPEKRKRCPPTRLINGTRKIKQMSPQCDHCGHIADDSHRLLEHLDLYKNCLDYYASKRMHCLICDKSFKQLRRHLLDTIKRGNKDETQNQILHEKYATLLKKHEKPTKKRVAAKLVIPPTITNKRSSLVTQIPIIKSEPFIEDFIEEINSGDEDVTHFQDLLEEEKENESNIEAAAGPVNDDHTSSDDDPVIEKIESMPSNSQIYEDDDMSLTIKVDPDHQETLLPNHNKPKLIAHKTNAKKISADLGLNYGTLRQSSFIPPHPKRRVVPVRERQNKINYGAQSLNIAPTPLIAIPISSSTSAPIPQQIQLNGQNVNVIQLPSNVTTVPAASLSSAMQTSNGLQQPTLISIAGQNGPMTLNGNVQVINVPPNQSKTMSELVRLFP